MKIPVLMSAVAALILLPHVVNASVFLGARVTDRDVPMSAWKEGLKGIRPTVHEVPLHSIAEEAGLKNGDVIVSVNGTGVKASEELHKFPKGDLSIVVFRWGERKTLTISKSAFEPKVTRKVRPEENPAFTAPRKSRSVRERPDTSPPIVFNDDTLERRFGRSTPAPPVKDSAKATREVIHTKKSYFEDSNTMYADKTLMKWKQSFRVLTRELNRLEVSRKYFANRVVVNTQAVQNIREKIKREHDIAVEKLNTLIDEARNARIPTRFLVEFQDLDYHEKDLRN